MTFSAFSKYFWRILSIINLVTTMAVVYYYEGPSQRHHTLVSRWHLWWHTVLLNTWIFSWESVFKFYWRKWFVSENSHNGTVWPEINSICQCGLNIIHWNSTNSLKNCQMSIKIFKDWELSWGEPTLIAWHNSWYFFLVKLIILLWPSLLKKKSYTLI